MRDVLGKMRECGKYIKMRYFPHDCGMVDTYATIANNETRAVPSLCVLVPRTLLRGLDPQSNGDQVDKRVQQQVSARNHG